MSKSRKGARVKPRRVIRNPLEFVMLGAVKLTPAERSELRSIYEGAFDRFRRADDCPAQWVMLADAMNMAESLSSIGIASDEQSAELIHAGQAALAEVAKRHQAGGSWTLYPAEIAALDEALFVHRVQVEHCSRGEFNRAVDLTHHRCRQALFGNAPAGGVVLQGGIGSRGRAPTDEFDPAMSVAELRAKAELAESEAV